MGRAAGEGGEGEGAEADAGDGPGADEPPELPGKHRPQEVRAHAPPRGPPAPSFGKRSSQRDLGVVASASVILSWGRRPTADTADPPPMAGWGVSTTASWRSWKWARMTAATPVHRSACSTARARAHRRSGVINGPRGAGARTGPVVTVHPRGDPDTKTNGT